MNEVKEDSQGRVLLSSVPLQTALTMLCHPDDLEIVNDRDDVMEITPEDTVAMAAKFTSRTWTMARADADFMSRFKTIFPDLDVSGDKELADYPIAVRHVVGMIVCINKAINTGKIPFVRLPETYLHPRSQLLVAQLMARYAQEATEVYEKVKKENGAVSDAAVQQVDGDTNGVSPDSRDASQAPDLP